MRNTDFNDRFSMMTMDLFRLTLGAAALTTFLGLAGCTTTSEELKGQASNNGPETFEKSQALFAQGKYEAAFKENQKILAERKGPPDMALFNMGLISAYSLNPRKDYPKALLSFRTLVKDYPRSALVEQAKIWIQVLEEHQKVADDRQKLIEDKRTLTREREMLSQEREKLRYTAEKSRQVDIQIEKRRRETLSK